jgi:hypothetical protein
LAVASGAFRELNMVSYEYYRVILDAHWLSILIFFDLSCTNFIKTTFAYFVAAWKWTDILSWYFADLASN